MGFGEIFRQFLGSILFDIHINLPYLSGACMLHVSSFISVKWFRSSLYTLFYKMAQLLNSS